jgi:prolyl-tRNA synthetase
VIEQNYDQEGIIWPASLAPFDIEIVCLGSDQSDLSSYSLNLYKDLTKQGFEVLLDDRSESVGVKLNDAYLLGIPLVILAGKNNFAKDKVEIVQRKNKVKTLIDKSRVLEKLPS